MAVDLLPLTLGARRMVPVCPPPSDGERRSPPLDRLKPDGLRARLKDEPLSVGARRVRPEWLLEARGARRKPLDPLRLARLRPDRDGEWETDGALRRLRPAELNPPRLDEREPCPPLDALCRDPPDLCPEA